MHVSFDLETLGTGDGACIAQIGAVRFRPWLDAEGVIERAEAFYMNVQLEGTESETVGRIDASTVLWWMRQSEEAQSLVFCGGTELPYVLSRFADWLRKPKPDHVWSAANFDWRILRQAYERTGQVFPLDRRTCRDYPTLRRLGQSVGVEGPEFEGVQHDALDDAVHQARYAIQIIRRLGAFKL